MNAAQQETYLRLYQEFIRPQYPHPKKLAKAVLKERRRILIVGAQPIKFNPAWVQSLRQSPDSLNTLFDCL